MSYVESGSWTQGWRLVVGLIIFVIILSWLFGKSPPRDVEHELETYQQIHETLTALRTYYPRDYARLVETLNDTQRRLGHQALPGETVSFLRDFVTEKAEAIGLASDADLKTLAEADLAAALALQTIDPRYCAGFVGNGIARDTEVPDAAMAQIDHVTALRLRTAFNGEHSRVARVQMAADQGLLFASLQAGDPAAAALLRSGQAERSAPTEQCRVGIAIYRAAIALPPEPAGRFLGQLFRAGAEARH